MRIDLQEPKRFQSIEMTSVGSSNSGKFRCEQLLYVDDLVSGIDQALSRERLDKLWDQFTVDLLQRRIGNCKTLIIATRWSVHDPIGRLESMNEGNPRAQFIRFPALNENDESNFDYENSVGFTTAFYRQQRDIMDDISWNALYQQVCLEREGLVFPADRLRRYFQLPDIEPDAIISVCDTKEQGMDYCVMLTAYQYGNDYYIDNIICDNGKVDVIEHRIAQTLKDLGVQRCRIESNRGGTLFAQEVEKIQREIGGITNITTKWTQTNKETRIQTNSALVKEHVLFKDESLYAQDREYRDAMTQLTTYSMMGKNKHDDVPDTLAMFVDWQMSDTRNVAVIMRRPF
jgi:predicted phage terminase large subunit-like protein